MDAQLKAKWVGALRGGKYRQARSALRDDNTFCCLGVLCDVMGAKWRRDGSAYINGEHQSYYLSPIALRNADLLEPQQERLYNMNDDGAPFGEIADYIEANL